MNLKDFRKMLETGEPEVVGVVLEWLQCRLTVNIRPEQVECPYCSKDFDLP